MKLGLPTIQVRTILVIMLSQMISNSGFSQNRDTKSVNSMLDELEKRLLDQESEPLRFNEINEAGKGLPQDADTKYKFQDSAFVLGEQENSKEFDKYQALLSKLEAQIDQLENDVIKTKQAIHENSKKDNYIEINTVLEDGQNNTLRSLSVQLNGFAIYDIDEASGLWAPAGKLPIYSGPLQPGTHNLKVTARVSTRSETGLPLTTALTRLIDKEFKFEVPTGKFEKNYSMKIAPVSEKSKKTEIKFLEN